MDCKIIIDLLPAYAEGKCSEDTARLVREHLQSCAECRAALERLGARKAKMRTSALVFFIALAVISAAYFVSDVYGELYQARHSYIGKGIYGYSVIPSAAFILSFINWCFENKYKSPSRFALTNVLMTAAVSFIGYIAASSAHGSGAFYAFQDYYQVMLVFGSMSPALISAFAFSLLYSELKKGTLRVSSFSRAWKTYKNAAKPRVAVALHIFLILVAVFFIICGTLGELTTDYGYSMNGKHAIALVIPAVCVLITMLNWFFFNSYRSKKAFLTVSFLITYYSSIAGFICLGLHYEGLSEPYISISGPLSIWGFIVAAVFSLGTGVYSSLVTKPIKRKG